MTDLTKITTPVGLLDKETERALKAHGGPYELYTGDRCGWRTLERPFWNEHRTYRVQPKPLTKPSINWDHVARGWNCLAENKYGSPCIYKNQPKKQNAIWSSGGGYISARNFASYTPGTCDWKDSLVCRPGYEEM